MNTKTKEEIRKDIVLKMNNCATNDPCAICGERSDPSVGPELFLEGTWKVVCDRCGERYAPGLLKTREDWKGFEDCPIFGPNW